MLKRISIYLSEMYPPLHFLGGPLLALAYFLALTQLAHTSLSFDMAFDMVKTWPLIVSAVSLCLFILMIRIMDEFKDYEDDKKNFPDRPLPSGRVLKTDLKVLMVTVIATLIFMNSFYPYLLLGTLAIFLYSALMYKWFFMEKRMRKSLPLALLTHHPVVYLYFLYLAVAFATTGVPISSAMLLMIFPLALTATNWEFSRKIRSPEQETAYTTYSKIWGPTRSTLAALFCQGITFFGILAYLVHVHAPAWFTITMSFFYLVGMKSYFEFLKSFHVKRPLKAVAEYLTVITLLSIVGQFVINIIFIKINL